MTIFRYKIEIEVSHLGVCCKFVFWDNECTELLGVSAAEMRNTMIKAGVSDPLEFPLALDAMLGLDMAFKVKWQPRWGNCSVVMVVRDKTVINQLKSPWECKLGSNSIENPAPKLNLIKESVDEAKSHGVESCEILTEVEITSKRKPEPTTPTPKRKTPGETSESGTSAHMGDGDMSSTKAKKIH